MIYEGGQLVTTVPADQTSYVYYPKTNGPYDFEIYSRKNGLMSSSSAIASCRCIGGPDFTAHLVAIRRDMAKQWATTAGPTNVFSALLDGLIVRTPVNGDIYNLYNDCESNSFYNGVLPDGKATVTVAHNVFFDYEVNYWLFGSAVAVMGLSADSLSTLGLVLAWRAHYALTSSDGADLTTCKNGITTVSPADLYIWGIPFRMLIRRMHSHFTKRALRLLGMLGHLTLCLDLIKQTCIELRSWSANSVRLAIRQNPISCYLLRKLFA